MDARGRTFVNTLKVVNILLWKALQSVQLWNETDGNSIVTAQQA